MHKLLSKLWQRRAKLAKSDKGFTLIELLVVVVILGVLIAIAIPLYLNYRKGANDAAAQSDLKNAVNSLEQCNSSTPGYPTAAINSITASGVLGNCASVVNLSSGTILNYRLAGSGAAGTGYAIVDTNSSGSGKFYCYNSTNGGSVAAMTGASITTGVISGTC